MKKHFVAFRAVLTLLLLVLPMTTSMADEPPYSVAAAQREKTVFLQNFAGENRKIVLSCQYTDLLSGARVTGAVEMPVNGVLVLEKKQAEME